MLPLSTFGIVGLLLLYLYSTINAAAILGPDRYSDYDLDYGLDNDDYPSQCFYNSEFYETGQKIQTNEPCLDCICDNGTRRCKVVECVYPEGYNEECTHKFIPGECCANITCPKGTIHLTNLNESDPTQVLSTAPGNTVHVGNYNISNSSIYSKGAQLTFGILGILLLVILVYAIAYFLLPYLPTSK